MQHKSTDDSDFQSRVHRWINDNGEIMAVIRFAGGAGSKSYEFFNSVDAFTKRVKEFSPSTSVTVLAERQLPIRGRVDDDFIERACASMQNGEEWLVVCRERITMGAASWYHYYAGDSNNEMAAELRDEYCFGNLVALGPYPAWLKDSETVITALTPNADGSVTAGAY